MTMLKADVKKWIEGTKLFDSKDYAGCISILQTANESSKICFTLGMSYYNMNKPNDALYYFGKSTEFDNFLAIGYFMRGVCSMLISDPDGAYWDFANALEKMRDHEFIDYTQLKMTYRLLRSEILFNLSLALLSGGRDASGPLSEASACKEVHDELRTEFNAGMQRMYSGQAAGIKPLAVDKTKVFQPPKVTDLGGAPKATKAASAPREEPRQESRPAPQPARMGPSYDSLPPPRSNAAPAQRQVPQRTLPSAPLPPPPSAPIPVAPQRNYSAPARSAMPSNSPGRALQPPPVSSPSANPGFGAANVRRGPGPTPGPSPVRGTSPGRATPAFRPPAPPVAPPVEMLRIKCYYKDKRLVEIPKDNPAYFDLKSRIETKFTTPGLVIKYLSSNGEVRPVANQRDLDDALAESFSEMYVNRPGEVNSFEPQPPVSENGGGDWQECYTDEGELYYYNYSTGESAWDPPAELSQPKVQPKPAQKTNIGGNTGNVGYKSAATPVRASPVRASAPKVSEWIECYTDDGEKYYYNTRTDESSWDPPT